jgi:plasmid stability protein
VPDATRPPQSHNLNIRIPPDLFERLRVTAAGERNGLSAVARRLLAAALIPQRHPAPDEGGGRG